MTIRRNMTSGAATVQLTFWLAWTVSSAATSPASSIILTADDRTVCAANQDSRSISLWEWQSDRTPVEVVVGEEPRMLAIVPGTDLICVTTQRSQHLALVDLNLATCVSKIPVGGQPVGIAVTTDGQHAFVAQFAGDYIDGRYHSGCVAIVNLKTRHVEQRIPTRSRPFAVATHPDGRYLYFSHYFQEGGAAWVSEIDMIQRQVTREFEFREDPDTGSGQGGVFNALTSLAIHPNGNRLLVGGMQANVRRGIFQSGLPLSHKTTVQAVIRVVDLAAGTEMNSARMISSFSGQAVAVPSDVVFLPGGHHFIDVYFASNDLKLLAFNERGLVAERALFELPAGPSGIATTRNGEQAFVNCRWERSVAQITLKDIRRPELVHIQPMVTEPWNAERLWGARIFHNTRDPRMTPNRWLSCGVCHLDGGVLSDSLQWEFSEAQKPSSPRIMNTKSLAITATSGPPYLILGSYQTIHEEDSFVQSFLQGTGFASPTTKGTDFPQSSELNALSNYVLSLRPRPNPHMEGGRPRREIRESAVRGRVLFQSSHVGCSRCHQGHNLTRSGQQSTLADVGTGIRADVPGLLNIWETAPYLHDGRASTLKDVLTTFNEKNRHGHTSHLSAEDVNDLVSFLLAPSFETQQ